MKANKTKTETAAVRKYTLKEVCESYTFAAPLLFFMAIFVLIPIIGSFAMSFFRDVSFLEKQFIFIQNYMALFKDAEFLQSLRFTISFVLVSVPLEVFIGLLFALMLNLKIPFRGVLRACILIPWVIPSVVSARTWELIYNYSFGLANFLSIKSGLTVEPINWLGSTFGAFFAVVVADVWKTTPFAAIILLAGLQAIPQELYAQAKVDRAGSLKIFYRITLPLIKPAILVVLLFRTIDALRVFDILYVLTHGGPGGATTSLSLYSYKYFLSGDFGYGSCISMALFIIAFVMSIAYVKSANFNKEIL